jgi:hypothetical protein
MKTTLENLEMARIRKNVKAAFAGSHLEDRLAECLGNVVCEIAGDVVEEDALEDERVYAAITAEVLRVMLEKQG